MPLIDRGRGHLRFELLRQYQPRRLCRRRGAGRGKQRCELAQLRSGGRQQVFSHGEAVLEAHRVQEAHVRAAQRRLAHAVCEDRHLAPQIRSDDEQRIELLHRRDRQSQGRGELRRTARVAAKVTLAQAVIEIRAAEAFGQARRQIQLLQSAGRMREHPELCPRAAQGFGRCRQRDVPFHFAPGAVGLAQRRGEQAIVAVETLIAEAIAVSDPGLVDVLARTRHHTHQPTAQHVPIELRADAVVRRDERILRHLPAAAL